MKSLLLKDIKTQWKFFVIYLLISLIPRFPGAVIASVGLTMLAYRLGYLEEKNNTLALLRTMPIKASSIVFSKFLSILILGVVLVLASTLNLIGLTTSGVEAFAGTVGVVSIMLLLSGIFFMLFFKLGYIKANTYVRFIFLGIFIPFTIPGVVNWLKDGLTVIAERVSFSWQTVAGVELVILGLYFLSAIIATKFLENRENF